MSHLPLSLLKEGRCKTGYRFNFRCYIWGTMETKKITYQQAKVKMEAWCAYQERCQHEVSTKLKSLGLNYELIDQLLAELIASRFIDEERFAEAYVSGKFRIKNWGKVKIKQHLKAKQISAYSIEKALKSITREDYLETILRLIRKKQKDLKASDSPYQQKAKVFQYLQSKGFEFGDIELAWEDFEAEKIEN